MLVCWKNNILHYFNWDINLWDMNLWDRKAHDLQPIRPNVKMARDPGNEVGKKANSGKCKTN